MGLVAELHLKPRSLFCDRNRKRTRGRQKLRKDRTERTEKARDERGGLSLLGGFSNVLTMIGDITLALPKKESLTEPFPSCRANRQRKTRLQTTQIEPFEVRPW
jgi:hypothetical protein